MYTRPRLLLDVKHVHALATVISQKLLDTRTAIFRQSVNTI